MNLRIPIGCVCSALALYVGVQTVCAAPAPQVSWASKAGGTGNDEGYGISALPDGSSIVTGSFEGTAAFGNTVLSSDGESAVFTAKMNADGTWAWAARAGGDVEEAYGNSVSALPDGSSIVTGYFIGSAAFGSTTLTSAGDICGPTDDPDPCGDAFTAKMNADGTWAWATQTGGSKDAWGNSVSVLPDGSSIVTGAFQGTATFGTTTLSSTGIWDVFTAKVNADGTWAWAIKAGDGGADEGQGVSVLADGSSIVTGHFSGTATFGTGIPALTAGGGTCNGWAPDDTACSDIFTAKVTADGRWVWATSAGGASDDWATSVSVLPDGSSIVAGTFGEAAAFGSTTLTTAGGTCGTTPDTYPCPDAFTAKMNADGSWAWATKAGGTGDDRGNGVSALPDGSSIVEGRFFGTAAFGAGVPDLTSAGSVDVFTAKMNADGSWAWAAKAGGTEGDKGYGISTLPDGSAVATGYFSGTAAFGAGVPDLTTSGGTCGAAPDTYPCSDVFTARYLDAPQAPAAPVAVAGNASAAVTIAPLAGGSVTSYTVTSTPGEKTCTVVAPATSCTVEGLTNRTSYTFAATATNAAGTGAASASSNAVTPSAPPVKGKVHCVATTCVTTGSVPAGATRITQRATTRPSGHSATGKCTIRRTSTKRTYSCTVHLSQGTWVITTTARTQSAVTAHFSKRVQVAPRRAPVTG